MSDKVQEDRLRRGAARRGLLLRKSRRRTPEAEEYGTYALVIAATGGGVPQPVHDRLGVPGVWSYRMPDLDAVEAQLRRWEAADGDAR